MEYFVILIVVIVIFAVAEFGIQNDDERGDE